MSRFEPGNLLDPKSPDVLFIRKNGRDWPSHKQWADLATHIATSRVIARIVAVYSSIVWC